MQKERWHCDDCGRLVRSDGTSQFIREFLHRTSEIIPSLFRKGGDMPATHSAATLCEEYKRDPASGDLMLVNTGIAWRKGQTCPYL